MYNHWTTLFSARGRVWKRIKIIWSKVVVDDRPLCKDAQEKWYWPPFQNLWVTWNCSVVIPHCQSLWPICHYQHHQFNQDRHPSHHQHHHHHGHNDREKGSGQKVPIQFGPSSCRRAQRCVVFSPSHHLSHQNHPRHLLSHQDHPRQQNQ